MPHVPYNKPEQMHAVLRVQFDLGPDEALDIQSAPDSSGLVVRWDGGEGTLTEKEFQDLFEWYHLSDPRASPTPSGGLRQPYSWRSKSPGGSRVAPRTRRYDRVPPRVNRLVVPISHRCWRSAVVRLRSVHSVRERG